MASPNRVITLSSPHIPTAAEPRSDVVRMRRRSTKQVRSRVSYMDNSQLEGFLKAAKAHGPREHAMFLFAVAHGARASEICNLRIADLNFKSEQVHIARLKGSLDSTQTLLRVKGSSLFNELAALKAWLDVRKLDADDFVFNSQKATRLSRITVYKLFRAIARTAGLPETLQHPHVLKHTAAMLMVRAGANAFLIRQHLGHRSFDSTLAYVNPSDGELLRPLRRPPASHSRGYSMRSQLPDQILRRGWQADTKLERPLNPTQKDLVLMECFILR